MGIVTELNVTGLVVTDAPDQYYLVLSDGAADVLSVIPLDHEPTLDNFAVQSFSSISKDRQSLSICDNQARANQARREVAAERPLTLERPMETRLGRLVWNTDSRRIYRLAAPPQDNETFALVADLYEPYGMFRAENYADVYAPFSGDPTGESAEVRAEATVRIAEALVAQARQAEQGHDLRQILRQRDEALNKIERITDRLIEEAENRGWCSEYDDVAAELDLRPRHKSWNVRTEVTIWVDVQVEATDEDAAILKVDDMSSAEMEDHVRNHFGHSYPDGWSAESATLA